MRLPENYIVERKPVKHSRIRIGENRAVRVVIPNSFTDDDLAALISSKQEWIDKNLRRFEEKKEISLNQNQILYLGNRYTYYSDDTYKRKVVVNQADRTIRSGWNLLDPAMQKKWYKSEARKVITHKVEYYADKHSFKYNRIFLRDQRTKWGNCSKKNNLSFNWRLIKTPEFVIDYLVLHELVHTEIMSHAGNFWIKLKSLYPYCRDAVEWLDKYGNNL